MELWIRSQDKLSLTKVSNLALQEIKHPVRHDTEYWGIGTYYDNLQMLGKYKSKERALQVLDEIQSILRTEPLVIVGSNEEKIEYKELSTYVYEMPEN